MRTFQTPGPLLVSIRVPAGAIELETIDGDETQVELEPLDSGAREAVEEAKVELRSGRGGGHELIVEIEERRWFVVSFAPRVRARIRCPHGADVDVKTVSADTRADGRFGDATVKTVSGDVALADLAGDARIKAVSGDVRLANVEGAVEVQTISGDAQAHAVGRSASVTTVSGDVRIDAAGGTVMTKSVSGDQFVGAFRGGATCQSVSGDVYVGVPRGTHVWIDANSRSGDVSSELEPAADGEGEAEATAAELRVKTMSGDIRIARA
jgi:DUF4097 and DUF4098 domain-containing protein YvlB